jgi:hypothetical protein
MLILPACTSTPTPPTADDAESTIVDTARDDTSDPEDTADPPDTTPAAWCARVMPGQAGTDDPWLEFSRAHAANRFFGKERIATLDAKVGLAANDATAPDLDLYAGAMQSTCALDAAGTALGPATATLGDDGVAVVIPGTGDEFALPEGTAAVVLDLRDTPEDPETWSAVRRAVSRALATDADADTDRRSRYVEGLPSADGGDLGWTLDLDRWIPPYYASGSADLPLAMVIGQRIAPSAAEAAAMLRWANRGLLVGENLPLQVVEARWAPVGDRGIAWSEGDVIDASDARLPDEIPADAPGGDDPLATARALVLAQVPAPLAPAPAERPAQPPLVVDEIPAAAASDAGTARAALIVAHGITDAFGTHVFGGSATSLALDAALLDAIAAPPATRPGVVDAIGTLADATGDGVMQAADLAAAETGWLDLAISHVGTEPAVRATSAEGLPPGAIVVAIDGTPVDEVYAALDAVQGGSTRGWKDQLAASRWLRADVDTTLSYTTGDDVRSALVPWVPSRTIPTGSGRGNGTLDDLGLPGVLYVDASADGLASEADIDDAKDLCEATEATILDIRFGTSLSADELGGPFVGETDLYAGYRVRTYVGSDGEGSAGSSTTIDPPFGGACTAPLALLVGPGTAGGAEIVAAAFAASGRAILVGEGTAGAAAEPALAYLPGGFALRLSGVRRTHGDGDLDGVGVQPDVAYPPTTSDLATGREGAVLAAAEALSFTP